MQILVLNSSSSSEDSVSRILVDAAVEQLTSVSSSATVVTRDLADETIPHLTTRNLAGVRGTPVTEEEVATRALSDLLIAEVQAADTIVIGAPMYNFSIPTVLRAWFDHVLRAGETFSYTETGPEGLLKGKRVIIIQSRGGIYSEGPNQVIDFQEPYLRHLLAFVGISDVNFVRAEKIGYGPDARAESIAAARVELARLIGGDLPAAAA